MKQKIPGRKCRDCGRTGRSYSSKLFAICTDCEKNRIAAAGPTVRVVRATAAIRAKKREQPKDRRHRRLVCQRCGTTTAARGYQSRGELCSECFDRILLGLRYEDVETVARERGGKPADWVARHKEMFRLVAVAATEHAGAVAPYSPDERCPRASCAAPPRRVSVWTCRCGTANGICEAVAEPHVHKKCANCTYEWLEQPEPKKENAA